MFNNQTFPQLPEDNPDLKTFRNIRRSKLYKFATHATMFACVEAISRIVKNVNMEITFILNSQGHPIISFQDSLISSCYHLEDVEKALQMKLVKNFPHNPRELLKSW
jgi:hypothetical protein